MRTILLIFFIAVIAKITKAQDNPVSGYVQDESGKLLHFVYVEDNKYNNVTFTDSLGDFTIKAHTDSRLLFKMEGYRDTLVAAGNISPGFQITLRPTVKLTLETTPLNLYAIITTGGQVALARQKVNVVGSRYLFKTFAHGFFTDMAGKQVYNQNCLYNYEKITGNIILTVDSRSVQQVLRDQIKSVTLYDNADNRVVLEQEPLVDKVHYLQVLASGARYKIFKRVKTKFIESDVVHTGLSDRGHDYDEYVDEEEYFVLDVQSKQVQKLSLRKKSIKDIFLKETDKVNKFLSENNAGVDDDYLAKLGAFLNS